MPSALETLAKILKQERQEGCHNKVVIGGLAAYGSDNWKKQAQTEARTPDHYVLAQELYDIMQAYGNITDKTKRLERINYMLDRLLGRQPLPDAYEKYLSEAENIVNKARDKQASARRSPSHERTPNRQERGARPSRGRSFSDNDDVSMLDNMMFSPTSTRKSEPDIPPMPSLARPPVIQRLPLTLEEAQERLDALEQPITMLKGIGEATAKPIMERLGIHTIHDMLHYLPRRYDDYTRLAPIRYLQAETVHTVIGTVDRAEVRVGRNNRKDFYIELIDDSGRLAVTFFGQHFLVRTIRKGNQIVISGKVSVFRQMLQMTNPEWEFLDAENLHTVGIVPVYPLSEGISPRLFRRSVKQAVDNHTDSMPDPLPSATIARCELADYGWTLRHLHFPASIDHLNHARRRYVFDQLITLQLAILAHRREWQSMPAVALTVTDDFLEPLIQAIFPYELTRAQRRAIEDIRQDVTRTTPMNRLIQGDVGSGKTAVAAVAMAMAMANGKQAALMAPTSILAEQHYRNLTETFAQMPQHRPVVALLTSALTKTERESVYRGLADGSIDMVIGTHALIQQGVEFKELAVAIVDEQHRFGVAQRAALRGKSHNPHVLVMTATPIPRTLALTMYADLDLSIIDEKPAGRKPVQTRLVLPVKRENAYQFVESQVQQGRQAFIIHPLVEPSETVDARSAVQAYEELQTVFHRYRVCLLHGRMRPDEKDAIMHAFANHEYDVMVTTSVAEVGVNIPNASIIVIEGANRFGLAQLHQFRGRVGRGEHQSFCMLIPDNDTPESRQRLEAMEATDDGFKLAEMDWQMRGAGELLGTRQSGNLIFQLSDFVTPDLVTLAQREARTIYEDDPHLTHPEHQLLALRLQRYQGNDDVDMS